MLDRIVRENWQEKLNREFTIHASEPRGYREVLSSGINTAGKSVEEVVEEYAALSAETSYPAKNKDEAFVKLLTERNITHDQALKLAILWGRAHPTIEELR